MAIRILHVVEALGVGGGVENGIANLIAHMDPERFEHVLCAVFQLGPQVERYPANRVRIMCLDQKHGRANTQVGSLARAIREVKPDLVHSRNWGALEAVFAGRWEGCPAIHSEHGVEMNPDKEPRRRSWLRRVAFELAHRVFAVSYQLRDMVAGRTGFPQRKINVIHNGVDTTRFRPEAAARRRVREELGIREEEFCIGAVGRLNRIKDYPTLLRAAELFSRACSSWRLLIVGSGGELDALTTMVRATTALEGHVQFLGPSSRVPEILNALDVYVLPSVIEGISNSLLEAMASGLPVVATDTGGNPEVVTDGESGLLFPVGNCDRLCDHLVRLHRQKDVAERLAQGAHKMVTDQFSLNSMVQQYEDMYGELAGRSSAGRAFDKTPCRSAS